MSSQSLGIQDTDSFVLGSETSLPFKVGKSDRLRKGQILVQVCCGCRFMVNEIFDRRVESKLPSMGWS